MSIDTIKRVWDNSIHGGSQLLLLLALSDHADIDGVCWPGHPLLAKKTRVTERQAKRLSKQLEQSGEIFILQGGGRGLSNSYLITVGLTADEIQTRLVAHPRFGLSVNEAMQATQGIMSKLDQSHAIEKGDANVTVSIRKGDANVTVSGDENSDIQGQKGDIQGINSDMQGQETVVYMSPEPSCNHQNNHHENQPSPKPKKRKKKESIPKPAAVHVYRSIADLFPKKATWGMLDEVIGEDQKDLDFWKEVIINWIGCDWNPKNVTGMLDYFKRRELPSTKPKGERPNGKVPVRNGKSSINRQTSSSQESDTETYRQTNSKLISAKLKALSQ